MDGSQTKTIRRYEAIFEVSATQFKAYDIVMNSLKGRS